MLLADCHLFWISAIRSAESARFRTSTSYISPLKRDRLSVRLPSFSETGVGVGAGPVHVLKVTCGPLSNAPSIKNFGAIDISAP